MVSKIVLDTNIWIYLTKENQAPLFEKLKEKVVNGDIEIFINDIIIEEWQRNRDTTIKRLSESIAEEYKSAKNIMKFLPEEEKDKFLSIIETLGNENQRKEKAILRVGEIEELLFSSQKIAVTDIQKLFVADLAILNKGSFKNRKNNFNDTLILRNIIEYFQTTNYPFKHDLIYVSNNAKDFCTDEKEEIYPEIIDGFEHLRLKNVTQLAQALELSNELIEDFDEWFDSQMEMWVDMQCEIARGK